MSELSPLRKLDITSTDCPALFGCHPYMTYAELWYRKRNNLEYNFDGNERTIWGQRLEPAIAYGFAIDNQLEIKPKKEYQRIESLRIGASFDFETADSKWLLEVKNVDLYIFKENWKLINDELEAPLHFEIQVQHQLLVSGYEKAIIVCFVGGNKIVSITRFPDSIVQSAIKQKAARFWHEVDNNIEPEFIFPEDNDLVRQIKSYAEPNKILELNGEDKDIGPLVLRYKEAQENEKRFKEAKESFRSALLLKIGDHEKVKGDFFTISCGTVGPANIPEHVRESYRNFRVFIKGIKNADAK